VTSSPTSPIPHQPRGEDDPARGTLRVLIADDSEDDYQLIVRTLRAAGYQLVTERVDSGPAMTHQLETRSWDLVLSDWYMPGFGASDAIDVLHSVGIDIPFIIVSGTVGEETAVEAMRFGAHDFLLKDKLARLIPAIERELRDARGRRERRRMQEQLLISDRMASVGLLAAGVAHEINNPLAAVLANLDLAHEDAHRLADKPDLPPEMRELLDELGDARHAASRIRDIVRDLKLFSRSEDEKVAPVDVGRALESSLRMATNEIRHRARLVKDLRPVPPVEANDSRLGQVFLNLLVNAAQAIPEGRASANEIRVSTSVSADDGKVVVEISDTGSGIPPEVQKRLFTPFFTTKQVGVGTGLGLSICHRIVTGMGGSIAVESQVGKGTTFRVLLPPATPRFTTTSPMPPVPRQGRRGRILVVDDEEPVVRAASRILANEHDVAGATQAQVALDRVKNGERFDMILCDLMMPEMTGMELHAELVKIAPDQADAMVFITGGAFTPRARAFLDRVKNERFEKPFNATQLRALVRERLG
jgi:signal transduction histidine kinase